jgi:hypothetical protein
VVITKAAMDRFISPPGIFSRIFLNADCNTRHYARHSNRRLAAAAELARWNIPSRGEFRACGRPACHSSAHCDENEDEPRASISAKNSGC